MNSYFNFIKYYYNMTLLSFPDKGVHVIKKRDRIPCIVLAYIVLLFSFVIWLYLWYISVICLIIAILLLAFGKFSFIRCMYLYNLFKKNDIRRDFVKSYIENKDFIGYNHRVCAMDIYPQKIVYSIKNINSNYTYGKSNKYIIKKIVIRKDCIKYCGKIYNGSYQDKRDYLNKIKEIIK